MTQNNTDNRLLMAKALKKIENLQRKINILEKEKSEPIAIIGGSCRFPGGADNLEQFWTLLKNGVDTATEVPSDRWDVDKFYDPDPNFVGTINSRHGCFLEEVDKFDASFFNMTTREAMMLDPQQRLLLEVSWESLEGAGIAPQGLHKSQTGVFVGIMTHDYSQVVGSDPRDIDIHTATGLGVCAAAGRLAYFLGLHGPALTIETACSSSLVGVHLACQSLRLKECDLALACGVNLILHPYMSMVESYARMLAPDGRCKTFDARANGLGRGEGCGVIVLKRLSDAIADQDNILALVRGSAVNQDGRSSALTVPNGVAQEQLIRQALANSSVDAADIDYVEAHGTGTSLGDPIEVEALNQVFGKNHSKDHPLVIGSVKTNIGHQEGAAGIAGLIKVLLALQYETIPPHIHFQKANPRIAWDTMPITIPVKSIPWHRGDKPRIAGISSFGLIGTNAHVVLEEAPISLHTSRTITDRPYHLLCLSAKTHEALKDIASVFHLHLMTNLKQSFADICFTANTGRSHFPYRLALVASSSDQARAQIAIWLAQEDSIEGIYPSKSSIPSTQPKMVFFFGDSPIEHLNVSYDLYETQAVFKTALDQCDEILATHFNVSLIELLWGKSSHLLVQNTYIKLSVFAVQYSFYRLMFSLGIQPNAVIGEGMGKYVASCIAGVFSLEDALKLVMTHSQLIEAQFQKMTIEKESMDTSLPTKELLFSTDNESIIEAKFQEFKRVAHLVNYQQPSIPLISNHNGEVAKQEVANADYWIRESRQLLPVNTTIHILSQLEYKLFLEISPCSTLFPNDQQSFSNNYKVVSLNFSSKYSVWQNLFNCLGSLYSYGISINWEKLESHSKRNKVFLPTYPWQRERYWIKTTNNPNHFPELNQKVSVIHKSQQQKSKVLETVKNTHNKDERLQLIIKYILEKIGQVAKFDAKKVLNPNETLMDLGIDSMLLLEINDQIETDLKVTIPVEIFYENPDIIQIAEQLTEVLSSNSHFEE